MADPIPFPENENDQSAASTADETPPDPPSPDTQETYKKFTYAMGRAAELAQQLCREDPESLGMAIIKIKETILWVQNGMGTTSRKQEKEDASGS